MKDDKKFKQIFTSSLPTISVSLLNSDLANLRAVVQHLERAKVKLIHLDVMDGHFVPNLTFGAPVIRCLRKYTSCIFDVHLMIENPFESLQSYIEAGADIIVVHQETIRKSELFKILHITKKSGKMFGLSIKPATNVKKVFEFLKFLDLVLVMTVEPGFGGQEILKSCISKIKILYEYRKQKKLDFLIAADGGINENNLKEIINLGCDIPVIGNAIFRDKDFVKKAKFFLSLTKEIKFDNTYKNERIDKCTKETRSTAKL